VTPAVRILVSANLSIIRTYSQVQLLCVCAGCLSDPETSGRRVPPKKFIINHPGGLDSRYFVEETGVEPPPHNDLGSLVEDPPDSTLRLVLRACRLLSLSKPPSSGINRRTRLEGADSSSQRSGYQEEPCQI